MINIMECLYKKWLINKKITLSHIFAHVNEYDLNIHNIKFIAEYCTYSHSNIILDIKVSDNNIYITINLNKLSLFSKIVSWIELNENDIDIKKYISIINVYLKKYLVMKYLFFYEYMSDLKKCLPTHISFSILQYEVFAKVDYGKLYGINIENMCKIEFIPYIRLDLIKLDHNQKLGGYSKVKKNILNAKLMKLKKNTVSVNYEYYIETPYLINNEIGQVL